MIYAIAVFSGAVIGSVLFVQQDPQQGHHSGDPADNIAIPVQVKVHLKGLTAGKHGLHVHQFGNTSDNCMAAGAHLDPFIQHHGDRILSYKNRHVGDLGNVEANSNGVVDVTFTDYIISLNDKEANILGRALVIHENRDDLGLGGDAESLKTGNAGKRLSCAPILVIESPPFQ